MDKPFIRCNAKKSKLGVGNCFEYKDQLKELGARWDVKNSLWVVPATPSMAARIAGILEWKMQIADKETSELLDKAADIIKAQEIKSHEDLDDVPVSNTKAWNHQKQAYHFVMNVWREENND